MKFPFLILREARMNGINANRYADVSLEAAITLVRDALREGRQFIGGVFYKDGKWDGASAWVEVSGDADDVPMWDDRYA